MKATAIRKTFLDFFRDKEHSIIPSAPLVMKNDPTLMFINSGMVQFKDIFLGHSPAPHQRIANTQKCLRVSGKHNDLEDVGHDAYHHTFFEMLGNWSFGDYFKKEAVNWAWELLTQVYKLPIDRLYVTVFGGDTTDHLGPDIETETLWKKHLSPSRILHGSKKDNFWEMGDIGPCGPCSEIHIDLRPEKDRKKTPGSELINAEHPLVIELWNLVFIQFNRQSNGKLDHLPKKHVDTGMGLERLCMALQGKTSNYETDLFQPLIDYITQQTNTSYHKKESTDTAIRVLVDHIRAVSFSIADGQLPGNTGAGYVVRRILRRAIRYGYSYLDIRKPFLHNLVPILAQQTVDAFPELNRQIDFVSQIVLEEEHTFLRTLEKGLSLLNQAMASLPSDEKKISGKITFELFDTYGLPFDLTQLIAREQKVTVSEEEFEREMKKQRLRSKADAHIKTDDWVILLDTESKFIGYDHLSCESTVVRYRRIQHKNQKEQFQVVLDKTPFYPEGGGQVGDTGTLTSDTLSIPVLNTQKENNIIIHITNQLPPEKVTSRVNAARRLMTSKNHSATHLLHASLRQILGTHIEQRGSLVNDRSLRFDFAHYAALTHTEITKVETLINAKIRDNIPLSENRNVAIDEARKQGAMALFGEKYGDYVRVVSFDPNFSIELCGGTHIPHTGQIGFLKIISEGSIASGVRRMEAIVGEVAESHVNTELQSYYKMKALLKNPKNGVQALQSLMDENKKLAKMIQQINANKAENLKKELLKKVKKVNQCTHIIEKIDTPPTTDALYNMAHALRKQIDDLILILALNTDEKPSIIVMLGDKVLQSELYDARKIVQELAIEIDGKGGGQKFLAAAGGKKLTGLDNVIKKAHELIN